MSESHKVGGLPPTPPEDEWVGELGEVRVRSGIWGEKPVAEMHWEYGGGYYHEMDMDFWLKRLRRETEQWRVRWEWYRRLEGEIGGMTSAAIKLWREKARLWDVWKPVTCLELFDKVEAVRRLTPPVELPPMSYHEYVDRVREAVKE